MLRKSDMEQLRFATANGRVLRTEDADFADPANTWRQHAGIVFFPGGNRGIGYIGSALRDLHELETPETMNNILRFL